MSNHENKSNNMNGTAAGVTVKTEPGLVNAARLSSFKPPRDLTLGANKTVPKKVFTPNLNVIRNKSKTPGTSELSSSRDDYRKRGRGGIYGGRGNRGGAAQRDTRIIQAEGVFSEGIATPVRQTSSRVSYSIGSRTSGESSGALTKPTMRLKKEWKIDKELEVLQIAELMHDQQDEDPLNDGFFNPTRLPINTTSALSMKKEEPIDIPAKIKEEPVDNSEIDDCPIKEEPAESVNYDKIKKEFASDAADLLQNTKPTLILLQFPDNLPGRGGADLDSQKTKDPKAQNASDAPTDQTPPQQASAENKFFTSRNLEEGQVGKIVVYKSGKIKLQMGNTFYDLSLGTQPCFQQDVMSVSVNSEERSGTMINMGYVQSKLTAIPDWERMFSEIVK